MCRKVSKIKNFTYQRLPLKTKCRHLTKYLRCPSQKTDKVCLSLVLTKRSPLWLKLPSKCHGTTTHRWCLRSSRQVWVLTIKRNHSYRTLTIWTSFAPPFRLLTTEIQRDSSKKIVNPLKPLLLIGSKSFARRHLMKVKPNRYLLPRLKEILK